LGKDQTEWRALKTGILLWVKCEYDDRRTNADDVDGRGIIDASMAVRDAAGRRGLDFSRLVS
jgi:hypothetical protein